MRNLVRKHSGILLNPFHLQPQHINIYDIAHALSHQCRFTGDTDPFFSVGAHSLLVSFLCDLAYELEGLMHDAEEYIFNDLATPIKYHWSLYFYRRGMKKSLKAIFNKYNLNWSGLSWVKRADKEALDIEEHYLIKKWKFEWKSEKYNDTAIKSRIDYFKKLVSLSPKEIEEMFLQKFFELEEIRHSVQIDKKL